MRVKPLFNPTVVAAGTPLLGRIFANVANKKIQQSVIVEIEKNCPGGMANIIKTGFMGNVTEFAAAQVFKKHVASTHGGDEQVGITIIVDIGKRRGDTDSIFQSYTGGIGDVFKL